MKKKRIIVTKFSSQYFDPSKIQLFEKNKKLGEIKRIDVIKNNIIYRLQRIFEGFNFLENGLVVVSSGAVMLGKLMVELNGGDDRDIIKKAVYATIGQPYLMNIWSNVFSLYYKQVSQILVDYTHQEDKKQTKHLMLLLKNLIDSGIIPIINFNDGMSNEELKKIAKFVDNDKTFAFLIKILNQIYDNIEIIGIIFSDRPLMSRDKDGNFCGVYFNVEVGDEDLKKKILQDCIGKSASGTGGMKSKVEAARNLVEKGYASKVIITGYKNIMEIINGNDQDFTIFTK